MTKRSYTVFFRFVLFRDACVALHPPAHPPVVVDRVPLEGFFPDQLGDHPQLGLFFVGFQQLGRPVRFFQVRLPRTGICPIDPSLGDPLEVIGLLVVFLVAQPVGRRVGVVQDDKGRFRGFCQRFLEVVPGFFPTGVDDDTGVRQLSGLGVVAVAGSPPVGRSNGAEPGDSSLGLDVLVVDGVRRQDGDGFPAQHTAPDGPRDLLGPINIGIGKLLSGDVAPRHIPTLDRQVLGDDRLAEFLVEGGSVVLCCVGINK
jgi:hypothetical protein